MCSMCRDNNPKICINLTGQVRCGDCIFMKRVVSMVEQDESQCQWDGKNLFLWREVLVLIVCSLQSERMIQRVSMWGGRGWPLDKIF